MNDKSVQYFMQAMDKLAQITALIAELEAMKAENKNREMLVHSLAYGEDCFMRISNQLHEIRTSGWV